MNDPDPRDPLSTALQTWRHEPAPSPGFNQAVWARIRSSTTASARPPAAILRFPSALPLAASLAVLLALVGGAGGAFALNQTRAAHRMAAVYARSIDPVQMTAAYGVHAGHSHP